MLKACFEQSQERDYLLLAQPTQLPGIVRSYAPQACYNPLQNSALHLNLAIAVRLFVTDSSETASKSTSYHSTHAYIHKHSIAEKHRKQCKHWNPHVRLLHPRTSMPVLSLTQLTVRTLSAHYHQNTARPDKESTSRNKSD